MSSNLYVGMVIGHVNGDVGKRATLAPSTGWL